LGPKLQGAGCVPRAAARGTRPAQFQKSFQKGQRHDWIAFKVPGEFSDVFRGQSCRARDASRAQLRAGRVPRSFKRVSKRDRDMIGWRLRCQESSRMCFGAKVVGRGTRPARWFWSRVGFPAGKGQGKARDTDETNDLNVFLFF